MLHGKAREMGLGSFPAISLADARIKAADCRRLKAAGRDPIAVRNSERQSERLEAAKAMTFKACADAYVAAHRDSWKSAKHAAQWSSTVETYAYPAFGDLPVQEVDVGLVMKALETIWRSKTETASRVRGRIESVLDWAATRRYRIGENPARWKGHLENLLPKRSKVQKVQHHAALPYAEIGGFMKVLRAQNGVAAKALEFLILTATRSGETIGAKWEEFDLVNALWIIPGERMKTGREHRVPLSKAALAIVECLHKVRTDDYVFPGSKAKRPLGNMALLALLKRMGRVDLTAHGFRSTFRDWAAERTNFPSELAEMALAHIVSDKVEAAYRRGDMFEKRRKLMQAWDSFCNAQRDSVVLPFGKRVAG
jgi:integrase